MRQKFLAPSTSRGFQTCLTKHGSQAVVRFGIKHGTTIMLCFRTTYSLVVWKHIIHIRHECASYIPWQKAWCVFRPLWTWGLTMTDKPTKQVACATDGYHTDIQYTDTHNLSTRTTHVINAMVFSNCHHLLWHFQKQDDCQTKVLYDEW